MPTSINDLSNADRADFSRRMAIFGLDASAILQPDLVVPPKSHLSLSMGLPNSFAHPHVLVTQDLDELKKWIGIPDQYFDRGIVRQRPVPAPFRAERILQPRVVPAVPEEMAAARVPEKLASSELDNMRSAALGYIWGHSRLVASYKSLIEGHFGQFQIPVWLFLTITVYPGSTLELGPGQNVLCAWKILIYEGGTILGSGGLNVQCTILQKARFVPFPTLGVAVGSLPALGT